MTPPAPEFWQGSLTGYFNMKKMILTALAISILLGAVETQAVRIKDIASFQLNSDVQIIGYGLVIGLDGTGDSKSAKFTAQSLANMMERMGVTISADEVKVKNIASVMVTARLSPFTRPGSKVDCTVSSLGDASSLQGGMLLVTPLSGLDGVIYATAQGPISIGGFNVQSGGGDKIIENYALVGQVPNGAIVEKQAGEDSVPEEFTASLLTPDFTTSHRVAERINISMGNGTAQPIDEGNIQITVPESYRIHGGIVDFISKIETLEIVPDVVAKVIINEKTGTIVAGEHVTISAIALAHGSLKIEIKATPQVSQPEPFSGGQTVLTKDSEITAKNEPARIINMKEQTSIGDLAGALNDIGATPRDIIAIFQALKAAGALRAELVIM
jgi:flagellar P-ring protein FlgI